MRSLLELLYHREGIIDELQRMNDAMELGSHKALYCWITFYRVVVVIYYLAAT